MLDSAVVQPFFGYTCNAWNSDANKKLKTYLQAAQSKCKRCCLKLNDKSSIKSKDFEKINWLLIHERISQCSLCSVNKLVIKNCPILIRYSVPIETHGVHTRSSYQKLNIPPRKTNVERKALSYVGPSLCSNFNEDIKNFNYFKCF